MTTLRSLVPCPLAPTALRAAAVLVAGGAVVLLAPATTAHADASAAALYCVTKEPDYVAGRPLHGGYTFCVPVPSSTSAHDGG